MNAPTKTTSEDPPNLLGLLREIAGAVKAIAAALSTPQIDPEIRCYTAEQAADALGVSKWWVLERMDDEAIPFTRIGKHRRIQAKHLRAIAAANEVDPSRRGRKTLRNAA
jgi:excisionase family DNA binding protein